MGKILTKPGNYRALIAYQKAEVIYDLTFLFCNRYVNRSDRTFDQMIQAARSGKQNIAEGSAASATSSKTEIKLINVAKASLKELLEDYRDYLRTRGLRLWAWESVEFKAMRELGSRRSDSEYFVGIASTRPAEVVANMVIILLNQEDYLLHKLLDTLEKQFIEEGGLGERMTRERRNHRGY